MAEFALQERRWIITNDEDFLILAVAALRRQVDVPSIIYWPQQPQRRIGRLVAEIASLLGAATATEDVGHIIYL